MSLSFFYPSVKALCCEATLHYIQSLRGLHPTPCAGSASYHCKCPRLRATSYPTCLDNFTQSAFVWATELENVHTLWHYEEPSLLIDGRSYTNSEHYYQAQKHVPFDSQLWDGELRDRSMEKGLRAKLAADPFLKQLLLATGQHPLLSIKNDTYWGFHPQMGRSNRLADLWMKIRQEIVRNEANV